MSEFVVIKQIKMSHCGAVNEVDQPIHLQQGSLDGACGPYCLFMSLLVLGAADYYDLTGLEPLSKRTETGKAMNMMIQIAQDPALFRHGTKIPALKILANNYKGIKTAQIKAKIRSDATVDKGSSPKRVSDFVVDHVSEDRPVILWAFNKENSHWVLVVGLEYENNDARKNKTPSRFLILDPSDTKPTVSPWNGAIDVTGKGGWCTWWGEEDGKGVTFKEALAIWKEE